MSNDEPSAVALVGTTGGAGTTRCAVETAAALAADGRDVAVLDAAFATQGLSDYVSGSLDPDLTALLTDEADAPLSEGLVELGLDAPGIVACCPANAPFERLARAKSADAARRFEARIEEAAAAYDHVVVDVPPVAANQAVAAVNACDRVCLVAPGTTRGADAVQRMRGRLTDLGAETDFVVATRGELRTADASVPESDATEPASCPSCLDGDDDSFAAGVGRLAAAAFETELDDAFGGGGLLESVGRYVRG
ncbi:ParA family protein [Halopelagius fulvigenes]|uniref:ParA family protein n=1 Tax=Halopelagius fulvigenes TaxID=1198324 RepID=A0ABD5U1X5_9EURY